MGMYQVQQPVRSEWHIQDGHKGANGGEIVHRSIGPTVRKYLGFRLN